jgi:hypothetical protein
MFEFPDPHVAIAHWMVVVLKGEWKFLRRPGIRRTHVVGVLPQDFDVILNQHAVMKQRDCRTPGKLATWIEARAMKNNIVGLPFPGLPRGIHQRRILPINRRGFTVCIGYVLVRIENLDFIESLQKDAAVAPILVPPFGRRGRGPHW